MRISSSWSWDSPHQNSVFKIVKRAILKNDILFVKCSEKSPKKSYYPSDQGQELIVTVGVVQEVPLLRQPRQLKLRLRQRRLRQLRLRKTATTNRL